MFAIITLRRRVTCLLPDMYVLVRLERRTVKSVSADAATVSLSNFTSRFSLVSAIKPPLSTRSLLDNLRKLKYSSRITTLWKHSPNTPSQTRYLGVTP